MPKKRTGQALPTALRHRINAGRVAVREQRDFFELQFGRVASEWKEDDTRVTFADFAISEKVFAALRRDFPEDDYCSEEANPLDEVQDLEASYAWVIDPIDGTNNYARGFPACAISLGLLKDGEPVYGFIFDFCLRQLLEGGPGIGIFADRQKVDRQKVADDPLTLVGMHFPIEPAELEKLGSLMSTHRIRCFGSGTLLAAYVATGYLAGTVDTRVRVWDIAAAKAICEASGVEFRFLEKSPFPLKRFHPKAGYCPYAAGSTEFCDEVAALMGSG